MTCSGVKVGVDGAREPITLGGRIDFFVAC